MNAATYEWSGAARRTFDAVEGRPLFHAGWRRTVFIHYEVDPAALQPQIDDQGKRDQPGRDGAGIDPGYPLAKP